MEPQFTSARQVAEYAEQERTKKAEIEARFRAQESAFQKQRQIEEDRYNAQLLATKERDRMDSLRHNENKRLSIIAIGLSIISVIVSIFK